MSPHKCASNRKAAGVETSRDSMHHWKGKKKRMTQADLQLSTIPPGLVVQCMTDLHSGALR